MAQDLIARLRIENKEAKQSISELKQTVKNLKAELKQVGRDAKLAGSQGQTFGQFGKALNQASSEGLSFTQALEGMKKGLGYVGLAFGAAEIAGGLFNKMCEQTQMIGDAVEVAQRQAGEAVNYFAVCMATCDFGNFLNGLRNVIKLANEAAEAMDDAASIATRFGWVDQSLQSKYNTAIGNARDPELSKSEREKWANEAKRLSLELADAEKVKMDADLKGAFKTIRSELSKQKYNGQHVDLSKFTDKQLLDVFDVRNFHEEKAVHDRMQAAYETRNMKTDKRYYQPNQTHIAKADMEKFAADNRKLLSYAANEIADGAESELKTALDMVGSANMLRDRQEQRTAQIDRVLSRIKKVDETKGTGTSKHTVKTTKREEPVYKANALTLQEMEDNVAVLTKSLKSLKPDSQEFKDVSEELERWQNMIQTISDNLKLGSEGSLTGMNNRLKAAQTKLDSLENGTDEFNAQWEEVEKWTKKIAEENLSRLQKSLTENAQTDEDINKNIRIYQALQAQCIHGSQEWLKYQKLITAEQSKQKEYAAGSVADLNDQVDIINKRLQNENLDISTRLSLIIDKYNLTKQIQEASDESGATIKLRPTTFASDSKRASYNNAQSNISSIESDYEMGLIDANQAKAQIAEVNTQLQALGMKPIQVHIETDAEKVFNDVADVVGSVGDAFSSMGQLFDDEAFDVAGIIAQAVAQLMLGYATASAQAGGSLGPWGWIAFSVAGLAQVLAAAAAIKNATAHANGGVVGGSSFAGDNVYARLNSGEMVLNNRQQKNLFDAIDSGGLGANLGGTVHFKIQGKDLVGVLYNTSQIKGKTGGRRVSFA